VYKNLTHENFPRRYPLGARNKITGVTVLEASLTMYERHSEVMNIKCKS